MSRTTETESTEAPDPPDSPVFTAIGHLDARQRTQVLDLWMKVNEAGGAVGFQPGAARSEVEAALDAQADAMASEQALGGLLQTTAGDLLGLGFWERGGWWGQSHLLTLRRLMVDPDQRRNGTGGRLLSGLHALARTLPEVELWTLSYRSGLGVGAFYARLGWIETGRLPLGIRLSADDYRDSVVMTRRPDGGPLHRDGRR